jgi:hypothetical protein
MTKTQQTTRDARIVQRLLSTFRRIYLTGTHLGTRPAGTCPAEARHGARGTVPDLVRTRPQSCIEDRQMKVSRGNRTGVVNGHINGRFGSEVSSSIRGPGRAGIRLMR